MQKLINEIQEEIDLLKGEFSRAEKVGAAAQRARVHTLNLEKMFKVFRKESVGFHKK